MSLSRTEYSATQTQTQIQTQDQSQSLVSRLRLRFDGSQIPLDLNRIDACLETSSVASLSETANYLFEVFGQLDDKKILNKLANDAEDTNWQLSDEFSEIKDQFLE